MYQIKKYDIKSLPPIKIGRPEGRHHPTLPLSALSSPGDGFEVNGQGRIHYIAQTVSKFCARNGVKIMVRKLGDNTLVVRTE